VIILDEHPIGKIEPVVGSSAASDSVFVEHAPTRSRLSGIKNFRVRACDRIHKLPRQRGYAETILKRRWPLPALHEEGSRRAEAERVAVNMPIQGSAADLIKVDIWNYKDAELQPMQKVRAEQELKRTYRAVFNLADKHFAQLATKDMPDIRVGNSPTHVLGVVSGVVPGSNTVVVSQKGHRQLGYS